MKKNDRTCDTCKHSYENCYRERLCDHEDHDTTDVNLLEENCILYEEEE